MKTLVIYTSQTGFTKKYEEWIGNRVNGDIINLDEAKRKKDNFYDEYETIIYGGWTMAGSVVKLKWFLSKAALWKKKKLAIFCVGASPIASPDVKTTLDKLLDDSQKEYIKVFYCQGGLDYSKMKGPYKMAMKAFASMMRKKKDATDDEKIMAEMISKSYDISDEKYVEPIVEYITNLC